MKRTDSAETSGVGAGLKNIENFEIGQIEDEYFGLKNYYAAFGVDSGGLNFGLAAGLDHALCLS